MNIQPLTGSSPLSMITESINDLLSEYPAALRQRVQQMNQCCPECQLKWRNYWAKYKQTLDSITAARNSPWMLHREFLAAKDTTLNTLVTVSDQQRLKQYLKITTDVRRLPPDKNATSLSVINLLEPSPEADVQLNRAARHLYSTWLINGPVNTQYCSRISTVWKGRNRNYFPQNDVIYPIRKMDNSPIHISLRFQKSTKSDSGRCYVSHVIETFLNKHTTPAARKTLYQQLDCRRIKSADVPTSEAVLIGQWGVFATSRIPKGSCIGIHAGMLINRKDYDNHILHDGDFRIAITVNNNKSSFFLEGDGITSKINSLFLFDDNGVPRAQQPEGYNVEVANFSGKTVKDKKIDIFGLFSLTDIAEGQELRLNYHYTPEIFSYMAEKNSLLNHMSPGVTKALHDN